MKKQKRVLHIDMRNDTGDVEYDLDVEADIAKQLFQEAIDNGSLAYAYYEGEKTAVAIREVAELDTALKVVVTPRQVGG